MYGIQYMFSYLRDGQIERETLPLVSSTRATIS